MFLDQVTNTKNILATEKAYFISIINLSSTKQLFKELDYPPAV